MKLSLFVWGLFMVCSAATQTSTTAGVSNPVDAQKTDPLSFVRVASDVYGHLRHLTPNNFIAVYIAPEAWDVASRDSDLAPFLEISDARKRKTRNGRSAACIFSPDRDMGLCVYFDGEVPFGVTTARVSVSGRIEPERVERSYQGVSKQMLKKNPQNLKFLAARMAIDNGQKLPAWVIKTP